MNVNQISALKIASLAIGLSCAASTHTSPAVSESLNSEGTEATQEQVSATIEQMVEILNSQGSLRSFGQTKLPKVTFVTNSSIKTSYGLFVSPECGDFNVPSGEAVLCPKTSEVFVDLERLNDLENNDSSVTKGITGTSLAASYRLARVVAEYSLPNLHEEVESSYSRSLYYDCFSGEILRRIYASSSHSPAVLQTVLDDMERFVTQGLEKHSAMSFELLLGSYSGLDSHLAAKVRSAFKFGFDPSHSCRNYDPGRLLGDYASF